MPHTLCQGLYQELPYTDPYPLLCFLNKVFPEHLLFLDSCANPIDQSASASCPPSLSTGLKHAATLTGNQNTLSDQTALFETQPEHQTAPCATQRFPAGRYSYICFDPLSVIETRESHTYIDGLLQTKTPFDCLKEVLQQYQSLYGQTWLDYSQQSKPHDQPHHDQPHHDQLLQDQPHWDQLLQDQPHHDQPQPTQPHRDLPPFKGGLAGYLGYPLLHYLEKVPKASNPLDSVQADDMHMGFYDKLFAFDHAQNRCWVFAGAPRRMQQMLALFNDYQQEKGQDSRSQEDRSQAERSQAERSQSKARNQCPPAVPLLPEAPLTELKCDLSFEAYTDRIHQTLNYIKAGDIYQANITRRLFGTLPADYSLLDLYQRVRVLNPAPFGGFLQWRGAISPSSSVSSPVPQALLSSSPERFIQLSSTGVIETKPIKGTKRRSACLIEDQQIAANLTQCPKNRAENVMIVDLMRNDLSRVAAPFSVQVPTLCGLETYATVHHLVSTVTAQLRDGKDAFDVLKATFPGGSITGAPKIRAMEIISELEPVSRGPYCGSLGYIGLDGAMDTNILIRTLVTTGQAVSFHVGGGIVADSNPEEEYEETNIKAKALRKALVQDLRPA